jgi:hypothetical protein
MRFYVLTIRSGGSPSVIEGIPAWDYLAGILRQLPASGSGAAVCLSVRRVRAEPFEDLLGVRVGRKDRVEDVLDASVAGDDGQA